MLSLCGRRLPGIFLPHLGLVLLLLAILLLPSHAARDIRVKEAAASAGLYEKTLASPVAEAEFNSVPGNATVAGEVTILEQFDVAAPATSDDDIYRSTQTFRVAKRKREGRSDDDHDRDHDEDDDDDDDDDHHDHDDDDDEEEDDDDDENENFCRSEAYRRMALKTIKEIPFVGLFHDLPHRSFRFEASGLCLAKGFAWVVFDSIRTIGKVDLHLNFLGSRNAMVPDLGEGPVVGVDAPLDSEFEGVSYIKASDTFLVLRETYQHSQGAKILSKTEEIKFTKNLTGFHTVRECVVNFEFEDINKGFEGIYYFEKGGRPHFMGLCETNFCKTVVGPTAPGLVPGNGRLIIAELNATKDHCVWEVIKSIHIPPTALFMDYTALAFQGHMGSTVAIVSKEESAVWIGRFNWTLLEFEGPGKVLHLPRDNECRKMYCNVESLQFLNAQRVVITSDTSNPTQPHHCMHKDESLAIMALPKY